ncbi:hypothetical protein JCM3774_005478 [Rhodotorula dairenensis]
MAGESTRAHAAATTLPSSTPAHAQHGDAEGADGGEQAEERQLVSHPDALISHLFHLCDPRVQAAFEPSHLTREWLDSLPLPPGCSRAPEPSSNEQWALVEQWRIAAGTIRYYAQFASHAWYQHQYWLQQHEQAAAAANSLHNPPWGSAFENDVRAEQYRLFGSAPLTERVAAAAAADAAFLGAFGASGGDHHSPSHTRTQAQAQAAGWLAPNGHGHREELDDGDEEEEDGDDDEDYEDEEDEDGREFSFPIDLAALAKSAGMPFAAAGGAGAGAGAGTSATGGGASSSTYEDIVNRLAQAQQQAQQHAATAGGNKSTGAGGAFTPAQLLQLQSAGAMIESEGGGGDGTLNVGGILSDSSDPLTLGPASLPSLMAAISELEQCVARLSLEASEARSLQRRMRDELGGGGGGGGSGSGPGGGGYDDDGEDGVGGYGAGADEEKVRAALEKKKLRNKKKKDKKKAKAAAAAAAAAASLYQREQDEAAASSMSVPHESAALPELGDVAAITRDAGDHSDRSSSPDHDHDHDYRDHGHSDAGGPEEHSSPKKGDGELIKALQSVSMLDRRADEYRERLRVLKEQIHHHAALADALAASSSAPTLAPVPASARSGDGQQYHHHHHDGAHPPPANGGGVSGPRVLGSTVASATVPLYFDGADGEQGQIGEYDDEGELYEEEEEEEEEEISEHDMAGSHAS